MGRCPMPCQRSFAPLESQLLQCKLVCSPPLGGIAYGVYGFALGTNRYDGALPQAPPKELCPFGIPTLATLYLVLLAAFGGIAC